LILTGLLWLGSAVATPFAVQVGEARIGLDAPPGFTDTTSTGSPRLQELAESLTAASNRILLFALSDLDLRRFTLGDQLDLRRFMLIVTPRAAERDRLTEAAFQQMTEHSQRAMGQAPPTTDYPKYLDAQPAGAARLLAELRKDPDAFSFLEGTLVKKGGFFERSRYLLSTTSVLLVRGKALSLSVYTQYEDPADVEWIRATTVRWIDELKRLNSR
jgi:hypothetical protein